MRQVILIQDLEIRDKLASSNINKFLYLYSSEAMPKQHDANMVSYLIELHCIIVIIFLINLNTNISLLLKQPIYDLIQI